MMNTIIEETLAGARAPWRRALRLAELRERSRSGPDDLLVFWWQARCVDENGRRMLPGLGATTDRDPEKMAGDRDVPIEDWSRSERARWFFPPGYLRPLLEREWGLRIDGGLAPPEDGLVLPPTWAVSGDRDNASVVQAIVRAVTYRRPLPARVDVSEACARDLPHVERNDAPLVEELATAFALVLLQIPHHVPELHPAALDGLRHAPHRTRHLQQATRRAYALAERVADAVGPLVVLLRRAMRDAMFMRPDASQLSLTLGDDVPPLVKHMGAGLRQVHRWPWRLRRRPRRADGRPMFEGRPPERAPGPRQAERFERPIDPADAARRRDDLSALMGLPFLEDTARQWGAIGRRLRETLESGARLPSEVFAELSRCPIEGTVPVGWWWRWMRREHLRVAWPHVYRSLPVADLLTIPDLSWDHRALYEGLLSVPWQLLPLFRSDAVAPGERLPRPPWRLPFPPRVPAGEPGASVRQASYWNLPAGPLPLNALVAALGVPDAHLVGPEAFLSRLDDVLTDADALDGGYRSPGRAPESLPLIHRLDPAERYRRHGIPKSGGGVRWIDVPDPRLARAQLEIATVLSAHELSRPEAVGFAAQRSTALHARTHAGCVAAAVVDVRDFFGSVRPEQLRWALRYGAPSRWGTRHRAAPFATWNEAQIERLVELLFHHDVPGRAPFLPQGSPASPTVANLVAHELDHRVLTRARERFGAEGWAYSRFADDLVLSTRAATPDFARAAAALLHDAIESMGWRAAREKSRAWRAWDGAPLVVCGIRLPAEPDGRLELPREAARRLRASFHHALQGQASEADRGMLAYGYAVTGRHSLRAAIPGRVQRIVGMIAYALAGEDGARAFVSGWLGLDGA